MAGPAPLDRLDPTGRFSGRAADYAEYRPTYPDAAVDAMLAGLGAPPDLTAADIGAGTGISSLVLARRGVRVFAIEPNAAMRRAAKPHPRIEYRDGTGERTGLPDASVDLVLCAQSFHWLDSDRAYAEFRRILRPLGRLALAWNERDDSDPYTKEYGVLVRAAATDDLAAIRTLRTDFDVESRQFVRPRRLFLRHEQVLDEQGLVGRATSASYVPSSGPKRDALITGLCALHARFADASGRHRLVYETRLYLADPAPAA